MHAATRWALPGRLSKPSGVCPSPVQVPKIYGWNDFLITVSPSARWPLAPSSHLSPSPAAPARATRQGAPFPPHCPSRLSEAQPWFLQVPSPPSSPVGPSDLPNCSSAQLNPNSGVAQVLHQALLWLMHLPTTPLHSGAASHRRRFPCTSWPRSSSKAARFSSWSALNLVPLQLQKGNG